MNDRKKKSLMLISKVMGKYLLFCQKKAQILEFHQAFVIIKQENNFSKIPIKIIFKMVRYNISKMAITLLTPGELRHLFSRKNALALLSCFWYD